MYIETATFSATKENQTVLEEKIKQDLEQMPLVEGCQSIEAWTRKETDDIQITLVTKWEHQDQYQAWRKQHQVKHHEKPHTREFKKIAHADFSLFK